MARSGERPPGRDDPAAAPAPGPGWLPTLLIFVVTFVIHLASPTILSMDSRWSVLTAISIVREGNLDLDEFREVREEANQYDVDRIDGRRYGAYPVAPAWCAVPVVWVLDRVYESPEKLRPRFSAWLRSHYRMGAEAPLDLESIRVLIELFVSSALVAATAAVLYRVFRTFAPVAPALLGVIAFAFGTSTWSVVSRGLGQHAPSMLALSVTLLLLVRARERAPLAGYAGLTVALAYVFRPSNSVAVILFSLYVLWRHPRQFLRYLAFASPVAVWFVLYSLQLYGQFLPPYFNPNKFAASATFWEGLAGNLVSPSRGLLVFSPFMLVAVAGMVRVLHWRRPAELGWFLLAAIVMQFVIVAGFPNWWGGSTVGPRLLADALPFLCWFLVHGLLALGSWPQPARGVAWAIFTLLLLFGIAVHGSAAMSHGPIFWNADPVDVDLHPERCWDWRDPQFLRGFRS